MYEQPSILERIRESDSPTHESSFIKLSRGRPKVYMVPAFDCLEGAFMDEWPRARLQRLAGSRKPSISSSRDKALIFVAAFRNIISQAIGSTGHICVPYNFVDPRKTIIPDWGNFDNVDGVGECLELCSKAKLKRVYWIALSGNNCRCGVEKHSWTSDRVDWSFCKSFITNETGFKHPGL